MTRRRRLPGAGNVDPNEAFRRRVALAQARQWEAAVQGLALFYGWRVYHTHDSRRSAPGFPDLTLVRGPELLFVELKSGSGRLSRAQKEWLEALRVVAVAVAEAVHVAGEHYAVAPTAPTVEVYVWRPDDWDDLHARLARGRTLVPHARG